MVGVFAIMAIGMVAGQVLAPILEPPLRPLGFASNRTFPTQILQPAESILLHRREKVDRDFFLDNLIQAGFNETTADLLFKATEFFPNVQDGIRFAVREAFREDIATLFELDANFDLLPLEFFEKMGVDKETLRLFWRSHWELPGISQGFEMFQRLSDLQLPFKQETVKSLGLTDDDVRTNQFELDTLLTTLDVMKPWQKRLTMIAYNPITRIDIRRFVSRGIVPVDEAEFRYREIGNSPEDAKLQVKFILAEQKLDEIEPLLKKGEMSPIDATNALNDVIDNFPRAQQIVNNIMVSAKKSRTVREKDLTRSQLENAFEDGFVTKDDFLAAMQTQGLDEDEANIVFQLLENKIAEKEQKNLEKVKKLTKTDIISGYISGNITRTDAADKLDSLRFNDDDIELLLLSADGRKLANETRDREAETRKRDRVQKEQSKSDTIKAFKAGVLSEEQTIQELREAKFSDDAIFIILSTVKISEQQN